MPKKQQSKYYWPSTGLCPDEMSLLHRAREASFPRTPITKLIAKAVRETYGHLAQTPIDVRPSEQMKGAV